MCGKDCKCKAAAAAAGGDKTQIVNIIPPEAVEILTLLRQAFLTTEIGVVARVVSNGADYFECPCCHAQRKEQGHLCGKEGIDTVEHREDCALFKAHKLLEALDEKMPVLFAE